MKHTFQATIQEATVGKGGAYINIPLDVEATFGAKRVKVLATFDGEPYRGTLVRYGTPHHILGVLKAIRQKIGKDIGDTITVTIEKDTAPRTVTIPDDVAAALDQNPKAKANFEGFSYTCRKEYMEWITGAKKEETRLRRLEKAIVMIENGERYS